VPLAGYAEGAFGASQESERCLRLLRSRPGWEILHSVSEETTLTETVLVVEDDEETRALLSRMFRSQGLNVLCAVDGEEGLDLIRRHHPAVVLLDLVLPKVSGEAVCLALRADPTLADVHVIMLTGLTQQSDRIAGFELGADDYITKPFDIREVALRIESVLRRIRQSERKQEEGVIFVGALEIDSHTQRVRVKGADAGLTVAEFRLLAALAERPGHVFTREDLAKELGFSDDRASPRAVDTHVMRLRQKLGVAAEAIETVRGSGYRFNEWS
jgi:two-component system, OmpR family, phosphate regulon response regulator PhoB